MKRLFFLILCVCMIFNISACGVQNTQNDDLFEQNNDTSPVTEQKNTDQKNTDQKNEIKVDPIEQSTAQHVIEYEEYSGEIPHIFTHCLIAYPEIKRDDGNMMYDSNCINVTEFKNLLKQLYNNGYSLVDIHDTFYEDENGKVNFYESVSVPIGRKPLIFSIDDVVYDPEKRGNGMVDIMLLDDSGEITSGVYKSDGSLQYIQNREFVPILECFIKEHPEFSSNGARMTLCMTGFTGVFGYRTDKDFEGDRKKEIEQAKQVFEKLKSLGYSFACHGYGHYDTTKLSKASLAEDLKCFEEEVKPIIGDVNVFVYPYGKLVKPQDERYKVMQDYGYKVFCSVSHFFYQRNYEDKKSLYMTRIAIDGYSLRNYKKVLSPLFDVNKVIDIENRK